MEKPVLTSDQVKFIMDDGSKDEIMKSWTDEQRANFLISYGPKASAPSIRKKRQPVKTVEKSEPVKTEKPATEYTKLANITFSNFKNVLRNYKNFAPSDQEKILKALDEIKVSE